MAPHLPLLPRAADLEAEINPSIETEERIREEYEAAARRAAEAALAAADEARQQQEAAAAEAAAATATAARRERTRLAAEAALLPEPAADCVEPTVTCLFRFPDGGRHSRRFLLSSPLQVRPCSRVAQNGLPSLCKYSVKGEAQPQHEGLQGEAGRCVDRQACCSSGFAAPDAAECRAACMPRHCTCCHASCRSRF